MITFKQYLIEKTQQAFTGTSGFYCSMLLSDASVKRIEAMCKKVGVPYTQKDEIHCTVMYSPDNVPKTIPVPKNMPMEGTGTRFERFGPEKDHLVLLLDSPELHELNRRIVAAGAVSTYPEYRPHVTVARLDDDRDYSAIKFAPVKIEFVSITIEDIKPD